MFEINFRCTNVYTSDVRMSIPVRKINVKEKNAGVGHGLERFMKGYSAAAQDTSLGIPST